MIKIPSLLVVWCPSSVTSCYPIKEWIIAKIAHFLMDLEHVAIKHIIRNSIGNVAVVMVICPPNFKIFIINNLLNKMSKNVQVRSSEILANNQGPVLQLMGINQI